VTVDSLVAAEVASASPASLAALDEQASRSVDDNARRECDSVEEQQVAGSDSAALAEATRQHQRKLREMVFVQVGDRRVCECVCVCVCWVAAVVSIFHLPIVREPARPGSRVDSSILLFHSSSPVVSVAVCAL
jgi:hypothetical protein